MKIQTKELVSVWAMSEMSQDRKQLTLRLDVDSFLKLSALKELFNRPLNDMINDLVKVGLEEVISNLPCFTYEHDEVEPGIGVIAYAGDSYGPRIQFHNHLSRMKTEYETDNQSNLKLVENTNA